MNKSIKKRIFEIIETGKKGDKLSIGFDIFIIGLIILSVTSIIIESFNGLSPSLRASLRIFEIVCVMIFTVEYLSRIWTANLKYRDKNYFISLLKYIRSPMAIIDLLAILPFYIPMFIAVDLRFLRILRLTRLLRIFKLDRYTKALSMVGGVIKNKKEELIVTMFMTFLLVLIASSLMYYIENDIQPDAFPNILSSFWWAVATLTTVGYGDVYPLTGWGRVLSGIIAILGIGLVALPTGIISSGFIEEISKKGNPTKDKTKYCPHCGNKLP